MRLLSLCTVLAGLLAAVPLPGKAQEVKPTSPAPEVTDRVTFHHWEQGDPPLRLIRQDEGFCALTGVSGHFRGGAERVELYVGDDGYWYLDGGSHQKNVSADCVAVRWGGATPAAASTPPPPEPPVPGGRFRRWRVEHLRAHPDAVDVLAASFGDGAEFADVTARVNQLLAGGQTFPVNPGTLQVDPHPFVKKALVIFCTVGGKRAIFSVGEDENVSTALIAQRARPVVNSPAPVEPPKPSPPPPETEASPAPAARPMQWIDPLGGSTMSKEGQTIIFNVPGTQRRDLYAGNLDAPRLLTPVTGDFQAEVKVSGNFDPGIQPAMDYYLSFHGAGLLVYADPDNFVRLERAEMIWRDSLKHEYWGPLLQQNAGGYYDELLGPRPTTEPTLLGPSTRLRLTRRGDRMTAAMSQDDGKTWETIREFDAPHAGPTPATPATSADKKPVLSPILQVGLSAPNTSAETLKAVFEDFTIQPLPPPEK